MRHAFGLPQVLMILLFIGAIATITLKYASINAQHYADSYTREQAELMLQSSIEATLLRIQGYDRSTGGCVRELNISSADHRFSANVTINRYYLYNGVDNNGSILSGCSVPVISITTPESHGMVDINVIVESNNTHPKILHPVRLERRSLQRP